MKGVGDKTQLFSFVTAPLVMQLSRGFTGPSGYCFVTAASSITSSDRTVTVTGVLESKGAVFIRVAGCTMESAEGGAA